MPGMGLFLDIVIIALLGATIFYAIRLSRHLDVFRSNRSDMERLIRELSTQITRAQEGVTALDDAAKESGDELRDLVNKSRALSEELALMNEAGNSLAERLEGLATRNRVIADEMGTTALNLVTPGSRLQSSLAAERRPLGAPVKEDRPVSSPKLATGFMIRDPDFSEEDERPVSKEDRDFAEGFESQSERDLAAAMRRRKQRDS
jgi:hypothetical protein